jgi:hypothetical protein
MRGAARASICVDEPASRRRVNASRASIRRRSLRRERAIAESVIQFSERAFTHAFLRRATLRNRRAIYTAYPGSCTKIASTSTPEILSFEAGFNRLPRTALRRPHALDRLRTLIRADLRPLRSLCAVLPMQVLDRGVCSGKMRVLQLSRTKELDSENRLSANFQRGAT